MVKLAKRCPIDLDSQPRSDEGFDCHHCKEPVFDTSRWTELQFDRFLERHRGKSLPCMRVMSDVDGVLLFKAEERMSGIKKRLVPLAVVSGLAACTSQEGQIEESVELRPLPHSTGPSGEPTSHTETRTAELAPPVERIGAPVSPSEVVNQSNTARTESQRPIQRRRSARHRMVSQNGVQSGPSSGPPSGPVMYDGYMVDDTVLGVINHPNSNTGR